MSLRRAGLLSLSLAAVCLCRPAAAAVALSYHAPDACPGEQQFLHALNGRGAELDSAAAVARARAIDVSIRRDGAAYVGELSVHAPNAATATRTVHDGDCAEVVSGLALTAAIALGRAGQGAPASQRAGNQAPPEPAPPPPVAAPVAAPVAPASAEPPERRWRGSSFGQDRAIDVEAGTLELGGARAYTLTAGAAFGLIPDQIVPRYELDASLASFLGLPDGKSRLFGPLLQVHWAVHGPVTTRHAGGVTLDSWGLEAGINSCSALSYDSAGWVALLCAEFGAGWLFNTGQISGTAPSRFEDTSGYGYGGLGIDVQYNFSSWAHLGLRAGARVSTPLSADTPDGTRLFESSAWGGYAGVGFGLHF